MAKANKTSFKKGNPGGGRKPLPMDILEARNLSYEDMCRTVIEVRNLSPTDIKKIDMEKVSLGKRAIMNAYAKLDYRGIKDYEDRLWGKAKEIMDVNQSGNLNFKIEIIGVSSASKDS
jgi:hypothetical protein